MPFFALFIALFYLIYFFWQCWACVLYNAFLYALFIHYYIILLLCYFVGIVYYYFFIMFIYWNCNNQRFLSLILKTRAFLSPFFICFYLLINLFNMPFQPLYYKAFLDIQTTVCNLTPPEPYFFKAYGVSSYPSKYTKNTKRHLQ